MAAALSAVAREEYERAAGILKPIAEADSSDEAGAQFLMGTLYENGRGVPQDMLRACALYQRAAGRVESPLGAQAQRLFRVMMQRGPEFVQNCQALARIGFDNRFEPVTFEVGNGRSVDWELRGATVRYQGQSRDAPVVPAIRGAAFLPLRHTALRARAGTTRHFVEMLAWIPDVTKGWSLTWFLFEITGDDVTQRAVEELVSSRQRPGPSDDFDPRSLVSFTLQDDGALKWTVRR